MADNNITEQSLSGSVSRLRLCSLREPVTSITAKFVLYLFKAISLVLKHALLDRDRLEE